ncbi:MAG TPA: hypothetical protein PLQ35_13340 [bacterium]|nr:hypothetical protein [bacterium]HQL63269.1 hypothetical protein [bacterium]
MDLLEDSAIFPVGFSEQHLGVSDQHGQWLRQFVTYGCRHFVHSPRSFCINQLALELGDSQLRPDSRQQLLEIEWFGNIVIGPFGKRINLVCYLGSSRHHNYRQKAFFSDFPNAFQNLQTAHPRHHQVQQNQVGGRFFHHINRFGSALGAGRFISFLRQPSQHQRLTDNIVIHNENTNRSVFVVHFTCHRAA